MQKRSGPLPCTTFSGAAQTVEGDTVKRLLLGIDLGTGGCKVTFIDETGSFVGEGYAEYPSNRPKVNWTEQDPADWYAGFKKALGIAVARGNLDLSAVAGICCDASAHNAVLLDENDAVLRRCIMWTDQRSTKESAWLNEHHGEEIFRRCHAYASPTWTLPQLMWVRDNEPETFAKVRRIFFTKDYLRHLLVGGSFCTDHIESQGTLLTNNPENRWSAYLCNLCSLPMEVLPPIKKPTDIAGGICKKVAAETGLAEGTPVIVGATDTALENYGAGGISKGDCVIKLATAGVVAVFTHEVHPNPKAFNYPHVVPGMWYFSLGTSAAAYSLRWYRDAFFPAETAAEAQGGEKSYRIMDREAATVPPGCDGLIYHPYLSGERAPHWDSLLRASFTGFSAGHTRGHFNRAILEGVAYSQRENFEVVVSQGLRIETVRLVGGGAQSTLWQSIMANALKCPIIKLETDDSSFGAAMLAGVALGIFADHETAIATCVKVKSRVDPDPAISAVYDSLFPVYRKIHSVLAPVYHNMAELV